MDNHTFSQKRTYASGRANHPRKISDTNKIANTRTLSGHHTLVYDADIDKEIESHHSQAHVPDLCNLAEEQDERQKLFPLEPGQYMIISPRPQPGE